MATVTGKITAQRRLARDIRIVRKSRLDTQGIFINVEAEDPFHVRALILGPDDTPYAHGNYFFDLRFDDATYPHTPPKVKFQTRAGNIRFNPNLYANGKVCVSILNTWSGPQWTSCQSLHSVLISLQTLLNEMPLLNEPGYENVRTDHPSNVLYNRLVTHSNYHIAMLQMFDCPPDGFEVFLPVMRECFMRNATSILRKLQSLADSDTEATAVKCRVYGSTATIDFPAQLDAITTLYMLFQSTSSQVGGGEASASASSSPPSSAPLAPAAPVATATFAASATPVPNAAADLSAASDTSSDVASASVVVFAPGDAVAGTDGGAGGGGGAAYAAEPSVADVAGTGSSPSMTELQEEPSPQKKKQKRSYHRKPRPSEAASSLALGHTVEVYDAHLGKKFAWRVSTDKRGHKMWKQAVLPATALLSS